ncbi:hypothetical protein ACMD2_20431, partial [Ananas comosus]
DKRPPLIVEDLEQPGHILIEMLCKEYGLFLEVARIIQGTAADYPQGVLEVGPMTISGLTSSSRHTKASIGCISCGR